jgi:simple sugar transport system substrate-binding protein
MKKNFRALFVVILAVALTSFLVVNCAPQQAPKEAEKPAEKYEIAVVVKITGIPWFNRLEEGVKQAAEELDVNAYHSALRKRTPPSR